MEKKSQIVLNVELNEERIPEKIFWKASESDFEGFQETKSACLAVWDDAQKSTLILDLWTMDMPLWDMQKATVDLIYALALRLQNATKDTEAAEKIKEAVNTITEQFQKQNITPKTK